ncbi:MAG: glycosyltransferase [Bacilli bacterium]|nr:glycosyltransferase [Bacilli bacterium]
MFTIIIPIYNTFEYLENCLESIKKQSFPLYEVIMVNDGSTDNSLEIMEEYALNDSRFKILNQKNSGISVARNNAIKLSKSEYIIFVDSDDTINEDLLLNLNKEISENKPDLIRYGVDIIGETEDRRLRFNIPAQSNLTGAEAIKEWSLNQVTYALPWVYAIKKEVFTENNLLFTPNRIHEDYLLMPFLISNSPKVSVIDYVGYNYLLRQGSISLTDDKEKKLRNLKHFILCYQDIVNNVDNMNLPSNIENIFLLDQYRRLVKEMAKSRYDIRLEALTPENIGLFEEKDVQNIKDKTFTKKSLKK